MSTLAESRALLEVREWREKTAEYLDSIKELPFEEQQQRIEERINSMLRKHGRKDLSQSPTET